MAIRILSVSAAVLLSLASPALSQTGTDSPVPTIPESQIEPRTLSTPFEFVATADAMSEFKLLSGELAAQKAQSEAVKSLAATTVEDHTSAQEALRAAGEADEVEIAGSSPDGEQQGLLDQLEAAEGEEFDRLYVESQIFADQRAIAVFRGYQAGDTNLAQFAADTVPTLVENYSTALELAEELGIGQPAR